MALKKPNPVWPDDVQKAYLEALTATPLGCGSCTQAEWRSRRDSKGVYFVVGHCRASIQILNGEPTEFCTSFVRSSRSDALLEACEAQSKKTNLHYGI